MIYYKHSDQVEALKKRKRHINDFIRTYQAQTYMNIIVEQPSECL